MTVFWGLYSYFCNFARSFYRFTFNCVLVSMKRIFLLVVCFLVFSYAFAQISVGQKRNDTVYTNPEVPAAFHGGQSAMRIYVAQKMQEATWARQKGYEGVVWISCVVEKDGRLSDLSISKSDESDDYYRHRFNNEAKDIVRSMPYWIPATVAGQSVRSRVVIPIDFSLHTEKYNSLRDKYTETNASKVIGKYLNSHFKYKPIKNGYDELVSLDIQIPVLVQMDSAGNILSIKQSGSISCPYRYVSGRTMLTNHDTGNRRPFTTSQSSIFGDNGQFYVRVNEYAKAIVPALETFLPTLNDAHLQCKPTKYNRKSYAETIEIVIHRDGLKHYRISKKE